MYTIGIIAGTGNMGSGLAYRFALAGYPVIIGSRSQTRAIEIADKLNKKINSNVVTGGTYQNAAESDVIVLSLPAETISQICVDLRESLKSKVVIDTNINLKFGKYMKINLIDNMSMYEAIQNCLPESKVVAAFKTISAFLLHSDNDLAQSDFHITKYNDAYHISSQLSRGIGLTPIRVRGKFHAQTVERMVALAIQLNKEYPNSHAGYKVTDLITNDVSKINY